MDGDRFRGQPSQARLHDRIRSRPSKRTISLKHMMCAKTISQGASRLQHFSRRSTDKKWCEDPLLTDALVSFAEGGDRLGVDLTDADAVSRAAGDKAVRDMLYNVENLRKRPGVEDRDT
jgi:hypothetical protein